MSWQLTVVSLCVYACVCVCYVTLHCGVAIHGVVIVVTVGFSGSSFGAILGVLSLLDLPVVALIAVFFFLSFILFAAQLYL